MTITVGTKIKVTNTKYNTVPNGSIMTATLAYSDGDIEATVDGGDGFEWFLGADEYEVLEEDTQDTPTPFGELPDAEQAALLLAHHRGERIECLSVTNWYECLSVVWDDDCAYRIAPAEPKREKVGIYYEYGSDAYTTEYRLGDTHLITFNTVDGVPDTGSIKMVEV